MNILPLSPNGWDTRGQAAQSVCPRVSDECVAAAFRIRTTDPFAGYLLEILDRVAPVTRGEPSAARELFACRGQ